MSEFAQKQCEQKSLFAMLYFQVRKMGEQRKETTVTKALLFHLEQTNFRRC